MGADGRLNYFPRIRRVTNLWFSRKADGRRCVNAGAHKRELTIFVWEQPGKGCVFSIDLPLAVGADVARRAGSK